MRMILVGALVAAVGMAGPAFGGTNGADDAPPQMAGAVNYTNPTGQVIEEHTHGAGAEFGLAVASSTLSILYFPVRLVYGLVGAELGGIGGWSTGGDMRTAKGIWVPTAEGHYFMRPDYLDGTERFRFSGAVPPGQRAQTVEAREVRTAAREQAAPVEVAPPPPPAAEPPAAYDVTPGDEPL